MNGTATVTILFTDVVGSVELRTSRGDKSAHQIMRTHFELLRPYIQQYSGQEVKTMGDGFMVAFGSAHSAVDCAVAVQRALAENSREYPDQRVQVRIGLNINNLFYRKFNLTFSDVIYMINNLALG